MCVYVCMCVLSVCPSYISKFLAWLWVGAIAGCVNEFTVCLAITSCSMDALWLHVSSLFLAMCFWVSLLCQHVSFLTLWLCVLSVCATTACVLHDPISSFGCSWRNPSSDFESIEVAYCSVSQDVTIDLHSSLPAFVSPSILLSLPSYETFDN